MQIEKPRSVIKTQSDNIIHSFCICIAATLMDSVVCHNWCWHKFWAVAVQLSQLCTQWMRPIQMWAHTQIKASLFWEHCVIHSTAQKLLCKTINKWKSGEQQLYEKNPLPCDLSANSPTLSLAKIKRIFVPSQIQHVHNFILFYGWNTNNSWDSKPHFGQWSPTFDTSNVWVDPDHCLKVNLKSA